jgi:hypothetical protein
MAEGDCAEHAERAVLMLPFVVRHEHGLVSNQARGWIADVDTIGEVPLCARARELEVESEERRPETEPAMRVVRIGR